MYTLKGLKSIANSRLNLKKGFKMLQNFALKIVFTNKKVFFFFSFFSVISKTVWNSQIVHLESTICARFSIKSIH